MVELRAATPPLFVSDNAITLVVKKAFIVWRQASAGSAMECVIALSAAEGVVVRSTAESVVVAPAAEQIGAGPAMEEHCGLCSRGTDASKR